jgi:hypothetical protein
MRRVPGLIDRRIDIPKADFDAKQPRVLDNYYDASVDSMVKLGFDPCRVLGNDEIISARAAIRIFREVSMVAMPA